MQGQGTCGVGQSELLSVIAQLQLWHQLTPCQTITHSHLKPDGACCRQLSADPCCWHAPITK